MSDSSSSEDGDISIAVLQNLLSSRAKLKWGGAEKAVLLTFPEELALGIETTC